MSPELWQEVEEILAQAWQLPRAARADFLARRCAHDPQLRREVESLLEEDEKPGEDFLVPPTPMLRLAGQPIVAGQHIGPYRILREINRGGMGTVYLAVRADKEFERRVALKVVSLGMDTEEIVRRFRHERQILAHLEHPNIARLLEGGTTDDARPYFVMEHVAGEPLDRYCDVRKLSTRERTDLFRKVCAAVQFAHRNLVIHRDLKPGNILVTEDGEPKLLDFGIAKLLAFEPRFDETSTAEGRRPMTLAYASPEQVRSETMTTATDIYSLGVLLYELFTGRRPYRAPSHRPEELSQEILEKMPEKPSTVVERREETRLADGTTVTLTPERLSEVRDGDPRTLRRCLAGDLDQIVLKALAKDPRERYASVEQLAEDLRRHLVGLPVVARKPTFGYRAGKILRRHRLASILASGALLLIVGFSVYALVLRNRAEQQRERAEEVSHFLVDLFQLPDPQRSTGETVTARALLDKAAESISEELTGQPRDRTLLTAAIGSAYLGLQLYEQAAPLLEQSLDQRRRLASSPHNDRELICVLLDLAMVRRLAGASELAGGLESEVLGLVHQRRVDHSRVAEMLNRQGGLLRYQGMLPDAELFYREALAMKLRLYGRGHPGVATSQNGLATVLEEEGLLEEAEQLYRQALAVRVVSYGPESQETLQIRNNLAILLQDKGGLAAAETLLRENLEIRREQLGADHPEVGLACNNLAFLLQMRGLYAEADLHYSEALRIYRSALGSEHLNVAVVLRNRASLLLDTGQPAAAEATIRQALATFRRAWPAGHWRIADAESVLGGSLGKLGRFEEAERLLLRSHDVLVAGRGPDSRPSREARRRLEEFLNARRMAR